jgi:pantothenate kinase
MKVIDVPTLCGSLAARPRGKRTLVGIAGPPGSGKSRLAGEFAANLNTDGAERAAVLPMDGYHYDDALLNQLGRKQRNGAPDTFDVPGLRLMLMRLRDHAEDPIAVPVFDRDLEISRAGARLIPAEVDIVLIEGNYLLLRQRPWGALRRLFDLTVMIDVPETVLRTRLTARWLRHGLPQEEIGRKVEEVDRPNGRLVRNGSAAADYQIVPASTG